MTDDNALELVTTGGNELAGILGATIAHAIDGTLTPEDVTLVRHAILSWHRLVQITRETA